MFFCPYKHFGLRFWMASVSNVARKRAYRINYCLWNDIRPFVVGVHPSPQTYLTDAVLGGDKVHFGEQLLVGHFVQRVLGVHHAPDLPRRGQHPVDVYVALKVPGLQWASDHALVTDEPADKRVRRLNTRRVQSTHRVRITFRV